MAVPIPNVMSGIMSPVARKATAIEGAKMAVPGLRMQEASQAASQVQPPQVRGPATNKEMALAFRELLNTGLDGAQAYVEEIKAMPGFEDIGAQAEAQLASLAPIWANPKLDSKTYTDMLMNFYKSIDYKMKIKADPSYQDKLDAAKQKELETYQEKIKMRQDAEKTDATKKWEIDLANLKKALPSYLKAVGTELATTQPQRESYFPIQETKKKIEAAQTELKKMTVGTGILGMFTGKRKREKKQKEIENLHALLERLKTGNLSPEEGLIFANKIEEFNKANTQWERQVAKVLNTVNKQILKVGGKSMTRESLMSGAMPSLPESYPGSTAIEMPDRGTGLSAGETTNRANLKKAKAKGPDGKIYDVLIDETGKIVDYL